MVNIMTELIEHHTKYKEIHGEDETVWMTPSEHRKLHNRLRRENKCEIPADKLRKIASKAHGRTTKYRERIKQRRQTQQYKDYQKQYRQTQQRKEYMKEYRQTEQYKNYQKEYRLKHKGVK